MNTKSGNKLYPIGIGTWLIGGTFDRNPTAKYNGAQASYDNEETEIDAVRYSIKNGQNHIDCAELYGAFHTDEVIGKALLGFDREDLYLADKLWETSVGKDLVRPTVDKMLEKLGTSYLDMLYIHAPWDDVDWKEAIPQIDTLIEAGLVREFGVSNFTVGQMQTAQAIARHPITANQMNYNVLYKDEVNSEFKQYCKDNNIQIVAYQPVKRKEVLDNETIGEIASNHEATSAQVALAWLLRQGVLPIPKAIDKNHIDENIASVNIKLTDDELAKLDSV